MCKLTGGLNSFLKSRRVSIFLRSMIDAEKLPRKKALKRERDPVRGITTVEPCAAVKSCLMPSWSPATSSQSSSLSCFWSFGPDFMK